MIAEIRRLREEGLEAELIVAKGELQGTLCRQKEMEVELCEMTEAADDRKRKFLVIQGNFKEREDELLGQVS